MKRYLIQFVVQANSVPDAMSQAEKYLNTGTRVVDFDVKGCLGPVDMDAEPGLDPGPVPAERRR